MPVTAMIQWKVNRKKGGGWGGAPGEGGGVRNGQQGGADWDGGMGLGRI